jgi:hypothetical protein
LYAAGLPGEPPQGIQGISVGPSQERCSAGRHRIVDRAPPLQRRFQRLGASLRADRRAEALEATLERRRAIHDAVPSG